MLLNNQQADNPTEQASAEKEANSSDNQKEAGNENENKQPVKEDSKNRFTMTFESEGEDSTSSKQGDVDGTTETFTFDEDDFKAKQTLGQEDESHASTQLDTTQQMEKEKSDRESNQDKDGYIKRSYSQSKDIPGGEQKTTIVQNNDRVSQIKETETTSTNKEGNRVTQQTEEIESQWGKETGLKIYRHLSGLAQNINNPDKFMDIMAKIKGEELTPDEKEYFENRLDLYKEKYRLAEKNLSSGRGFGYVKDYIKVDIKGFIAGQK